MNILVITYWKFADALIQTYTLPYLRIMLKVLPPGSEITLITMEPEGTIRKGIPVEQGIVRYSFRSYPFGVRAMIAWSSNFRHLRKIVREKNITTIHTWCTPAGGIGERLSKQTGVPLVLDSFEPHAEPMVETGTWKKGGPAFRSLFSMERKQVHRARWIIGVVSAMKEYAEKKYRYHGSNFLIKPACIDFSTFNLLKRKDAALKEKTGFTGHEVVCVYAGKFGGLYMTDEAFRFFRIAKEVFGKEFRVLLLSPAPQEEVFRYCINNGLDPAVIHHVFVPHEEVAGYMGLGDFAFSAFKPVESRKYCTPIKNGEYWAMGLPVVIGEGISEDSDIIRANNAGYVLRTLSDEEFRAAAWHIRQMLAAEDRGKLANRIHQLAQKHRNFAIAEEVYRTIYSNV
jgi:glycosyltransferase involved in cell wall biosynthesis